MKKNKAIKNMSLLELQQHKQDLLDTLKYLKKNKWNEELEALNGIDKKTFESNTRHAIAFTKEALGVVDKKILEKMGK